MDVHQVADVFDALSEQGLTKPGSTSSSIGEHIQGRPLLTPDEVMQLGPARPIVLVAANPPTCWIASAI